MTAKTNTKKATDKKKEEAKAASHTAKKTESKAADPNQADPNQNKTMDPKKGPSHDKGGELWLIDLISPFHTPENKMADKMLADLMNGPFKGKRFKFHHTDPKSGERKVMELGG